MPEAVNCEHCGNPVTATAPSGLCPRCLLHTAIEQGAGRALAPLLPKLRYFGDYELLEEIARGGMGVVYRARQVSLDRVVAVKMMRPGVLATEDEIRRFQTEARMAAGMQHPNIVAIHEVGEFEGLHYFSMDFVEGPSLAELVRQKPLGQQEAARYVRVLCEAVHYAHSKGILHRDLKPSNVLVDSGGRPRITDFGLARHMDGGSGMTVIGTLVGTPAYMPPEQAAAEGAPLSPASDGYSLGAILYELLTGSPPFRGASAVAIARMVMEEKPVPPRDVDPRIDRDLEAICMKCLEKDPALRYASAAELAADLERFLSGKAVQARRASYWLRRWPVAGTAAAIVGVAVVWSVLRTEPPQRHHDTAPGASRKSAATVTPPPAPTVAAQHTAVATKSAQPEPHRVAGGSVEPSSGSGTRQSFTFRYDVPMGAAIDAIEVEFHHKQSDRACRIFLMRDTGRVQLQFNPVKGPGLRIGGQSGELSVLQNAVCAVDLSEVAATRRDLSLEVRLNVTFDRSFGGLVEVHSWPLDGLTGARLPSGIRGTWNVP